MRNRNFLFSMLFVFACLLSSLALQTDNPKKNTSTKGDSDKPLATTPKKQEQKKEAPAAAAKDEKKPEAPKKSEEDKPKDPFSAEAFSGLKLRSVGPALVSGRI